MTSNLCRKFQTLKSIAETQTPEIHPVVGPNKQNELTPGEKRMHYATPSLKLHWAKVMTLLTRNFQESNYYASVHFPIHYKQLIMSGY